MKTKTLYLKPNETGWNTAVSIQISALDETQGIERAGEVTWEMQSSCPEGEIWLSSRGERAINLAAILDSDKAKKLFESGSTATDLLIVTVGILSIAALAVTIGAIPVLIGFAELAKVLAFNF